MPAPLSLALCAALAACEPHAYFHSTPGWSARNQNGQAVSVLHADDPAELPVCAVWMKVPDNASSISGDSLHGEKGSWRGVSVEARKLSMTQPPLHEPPREFEHVLEVDGTRYELTKGRVFLVDTLAKPITVTQMPVTREEFEPITSRELGQGQIVQALRKALAGQPNVKGW